MNNAERPYADRRAAGRRLGEALGAYRQRDDVLVLGVPRGGIPVAYEVAAALRAPLDVLMVRKMALPSQPSVAMGAIASGGAQILLPEALQHAKVSDAELRDVVERHREDLEHRAAVYRGERPEPEIAARCLILVDDGLASGATMRAGVAAIRQKKPECIVVAIPVAPPRVVEQLRAEADEVVCPLTPASFRGLSHWYEDYSELSNEQVKALLREAWG